MRRIPFLTKEQRQQIPDETLFYATAEMAYQNGACYTARETFKRVFKVGYRDRVFLTLENYRRFKRNTFWGTWPTSQLIDKIEQITGGYSPFSDYNYRQWDAFYNYNNSVPEDYRRLVELCIIYQKLRKRS